MISVRHFFYEVHYSQCSLWWPAASREDWQIPNVPFAWSLTRGVLYTKWRMSWAAKYRRLFKCGLQYLKHAEDRTGKWWAWRIFLTSFCSLQAIQVLIYLVLTSSIRHCSKADRLKQFSNSTRITVTNQDYSAQLYIGLWTTRPTFIAQTILIIVSLVFSTNGRMTFKLLWSICNVESKHKLFFNWHN